MKFLSKLFGRGSEEEVTAADVDAAEVTTADETSSAEEPSTEEPLPEADSAEVSPDPSAFEQIADADEPVSQPSTDSAVPSEPEAISSALGVEPRRDDLHQAVTAAFPEASERVDFYQKLSQAYANEPYHSLSLGRAYRAAGQLRESVAHYQQYLRSATEASVLEELADVFEQLGEAYMANSSRMVASTLKNKG